jgi:hypothetical protein
MQIYADVLLVKIALGREHPVNPIYHQLITCCFSGVNLKKPLFINQPMGIWDIGNGDGISGTPYFSNVAQMCPVVQAGTPEPRNPEPGPWEVNMPAIF